MKNTWLLPSLLFCGIFIFSSCDDDSGSTPINPLVGKWVLESISITGCTDDSENGTYTLSCTEDNCSNVTVSSQGGYLATTTLLGITETDEGTYQVLGNIIEICSEGGVDCSSAELQLLQNNRKMQLKESDAESGCVTTAIYKKL